MYFVSSFVPELWININLVTRDCYTLNNYINVLYSKKCLRFVFCSPRIPGHAASSPSQGNAASGPPALTDSVLNNL